MNQDFIMFSRLIGNICNKFISKRTLQTYRKNELLPYSQIRHKVFYKPEDVDALLKSSYQPNTSER